MKSIVVLLSTAVLLAAAVLATGQSFDVVSLGSIIFVAGLAAFAVADYTPQPRHLTRVTARPPCVARPLRTPAPAPVYCPHVSTDTIAA